MVISVMNATTSEPTTTEVIDVPSSATHTMMTPQPLKGRVMRSSIWMFGGYMMTQALRLAANLVLTRLLLPEEFGLMAMVLVAILGLEMLSDLGITPAIVQNPRGDDKDFLNTAWTIQVIRGLVLWALALPIAHLLAAWFREPKLVTVLLIASATAAIAGFNSTKLATCQRYLHLGPFVAIDVGAYIIGAIVMIWWATFHPSVWALVAGTLATAVSKMILSHVALPGHSNRWHWDRSAVVPLIRFGRWIFVSTLMTYLALQADKLLLGRLLAPNVFGVYGFGFMVATLPVNVVRKVSSFALYPALSQTARENAAQLRSKLIDARRVLLPAGMLAVIICVVWAPAFFGYCFRGPYKEAAWMCQILALPVWFQILQASVDRALLALGGTYYLALSNVCNFVATVCLCLLGHAIWKLPGFIVGLGAGSLIGHAVIQWTLIRYGINLIMQDLRYCFLLAGAVAIALGVAKGILGNPLTVSAPTASLLLGAPFVCLMGIFVIYRLRAGLLPIQNHHDSFNQ